MRRASKFYIAAAGIAGVILMQYFGHELWATDLIGALTALGVYQVPNKAG